MFEILQDGFHTPLTEAQIAKLFRAGRLGRRTPCKRCKQSEWRTIDEVFPLLKYHAPWRLGADNAEPSSEFRVRRTIVVATSLVLIFATALATYPYWQGQRTADRRITTIDSAVPPTVRSSVHRAPVNTTSAQTTFTRSSTSRVFTTNAAPVNAVSVQQGDTQSAIRSAEAQRIAEQARRDQAMAEQQRALHEQMLREQQKIAGRDEHVPLDQSQIVIVGGEPVRVKIHDNDVTSFDVWINGACRRQVPKAKGVTHSRTDETLIYSNGRAALYYVWEISGRLNHCLLRVRDA